MKKILYSVLVALSALFPLSVNAQQESLFTYPVPPDTLLNFQPRCDYIISRFWDRCNFEQALLHPDEFNKAFGDWVNIMPHASADTVHSTIDRLLARFTKKGGDQALALARLAENWVYSDTSELVSEEIMLPFAHVAANHKKIDKADRRHFAAIEKVLTSSMVGQTLPDLEFVRPDGTKGHLSDIARGSVLLFFCDPGDPASSFPRIRLDTDPDTRELIDRGELTIVTIYASEPDSKWLDNVKDYPENWHNVAIPDAAEYFGKIGSPMLYFLNSGLKVLAKNLSADYLLGAFKYTNDSRKKQ